MLGGGPLGGFALGDYWIFDPTVVITLPSTVEWTWDIPGTTAVEPGPSLCVGVKAVAARGTNPDMFAYSLGCGTNNETYTCNG